MKPKPAFSRILTSSALGLSAAQSAASEASVIHGAVDDCPLV
jgi:hypothetical protein